MPVNGSVVSVTGVPQGALSFSVPGIDFYTLTVSGQAAIWYSFFDTLFMKYRNRFNVTRE